MRSATSVRVPTSRHTQLTRHLRHTGFLACARYGKGRITDSFTVTTGTTAVRPIPAVTNLVGGGGAAIAAAAQTLAIDLAPVRANCIAPGLVLTELWDVRALVLPPPRCTLYSF